MPGNRHRAIVEKTLLAVAAVFLLVGLAALGFLQTLSRENRALIVIVSSVGVIACFAGQMSTRTIWKLYRSRTWRRAMSAWTENAQSGNAPKFDLAAHLADGGLRHLAIRVFSQMGYVISNRDGEQAYLRLVNPEGWVELVACRQQPNPAEVRHIVSLHLEMKKADAVRGFYWSPGGFTDEAIHWARQKPIVLADQNEIGRLVDCAHEKGSTLLEYG